MKFKIQNEAWKRDDKRLISNVTETQVTINRSFPPHTEENFTANERTYLDFAVDYLIRLQEIVIDNYTNVYRAYIYQFVDMFLCEKNVT